MTLTVCCVAVAVVVVAVTATIRFSNVVRVFARFCVYMFEVSKHIGIPYHNTQIH